LGVWLGDGRSRILSITTEDHEILGYLSNFASTNGFELKELNTKCGNAKEYFLKNRNENPIRAYFRENLFLNKHIPQEYIVNSREVRLQVLAGLLDTDGFLHSQDHSTFEYCSKYEKLRDQVAFLCRTLGLTARCFTRHNKKYNSDFYYCTIFGNTAEIPTRIRRKKATNNPNKNNLVHGISARDIGEGEYFGFEISGPDRMFLLWDCTVAHNTVIGAHIPRQGRMLWLSHREELVYQPKKYFSCSFGIERAGEHSHGEEVVSASVQTLVRRLDKFDPYDFDVVLVDESHHSVSATYRKILDYFEPRLRIGITATVNRGDNVRLDTVFDKIIFQRDLRWGIKNGYLTDIYCLRVNIGYDLSAVRTRMGDYAPGELEEAMEGTADAIAEAYRDYAKGATLIFAVSVHQAQEIAARIPGAVVVTGETKNRASIIQDFTDGKIPCIVNVMVFTEGTDIPRVETVIMARPTQSESLYCQCVGRGLRLYPGKEKLTLIDCVGVTGKKSLCTAPSLLGIDASNIPERKQNELQGDLFELPVKAAAASDCPESWIRNVEIVNLWAKEQSYTTHNVSWFKMPTGELVLSLPDQKKMVIPCPDSLGMVTLKDGSYIPMQEALDRAYTVLNEHCGAYRYIWDLGAVKKWGKKPASESQLKIINRMCKGFDTSELTKGQASQILNRLFNGKPKKR
jgi:hypothetical protein